MPEDKNLCLCGGCGKRVVKPCRTFAEKLGCSRHEAAHDKVVQLFPEDEVGSHFFDLPYGVRDHYTD